ncbi:hypothetical protein TNCV_450511 [Trichonephila clavipes]|nr:hypothetical protein TNCV_450511 [Trichonephila clavipes]
MGLKKSIQEKNRSNGFMRIGQVGNLAQWKTKCYTARNNCHLFCMAATNSTTLYRQLIDIGDLSQMYHFLQQFVSVCCTVDFKQKFLSARFPQKISACGFHGLVGIDTDTRRLKILFSYETSFNFQKSNGYNSVRRYIRRVKLAARGSQRVLLQPGQYIGAQ